MNPTTVVIPLFRAAVLTQLTAQAAAHEDAISTAVLTEIATATDAINRAIAQLMYDHDLEPADMQPLLDAITAELAGGEDPR